MVKPASQTQPDLAEVVRWSFGTKYDGSEARNTCRKHLQTRRSDQKCRNERPDPGFRNGVDSFFGDPYQNAMGIVDDVEVLNQRTNDDKRTVPYPARNKGQWTCICRANRDGRCPDNYSNGGKESGYGSGTGPDMKTAKNIAEKAAKDILGAKSSHHVQCRCTDPKGKGVDAT